MSRPIPLDETTRELLARVWRDHGRPALVLDRHALAEIEAGQRTKLRDEVLAILVAEGRSPAVMPELTRLATSTFESVFGPTWRQLADFDHVVFAQLSPDPSRPAYVGFRRKPPHTIAVWDLRKPRGRGEPLSVRDYLERRWTGDATVHLDQAASDEDFTAFAPTIGEPPSETQRRVRHAKFGVGVVLERKDGKLRVEFPEGEQLVAEAFVTNVVD